MYCRTTIVKSPADQRDAMLAFVEQVKPMMREMGALRSWWVECGNDEWTQFTVYPSRGVAEAARAQARRKVQNAEQAGAIDVQTVRMLEGTLVASLSPTPDPGGSAIRRRRPVRPPEASTAQLEACHATARASRRAAAARPKESARESAESVDSSVCTSL